MVKKRKKPSLRPRKSKNKKTLFISILLGLLVVATYALYHLSSKKGIPGPKDDYYDCSVKLNNAINDTLSRMGIDVTHAVADILEEKEKDGTRYIYAYKKINLPKHLPVKGTGSRLKEAISKHDGHIFAETLYELPGQETMTMYAGTDQLVTQLIVLNKEIFGKVGQHTVPARAKVAIIIDDMGGSIGRSFKKLIAIPKPLTFSILPHLRYSRQVAKAGYEAGKEIMLHCPMEPLDKANYKFGKYLLFTSMSDEEVAKLFRANLTSLLPYAAGVNNHMGSKFIQDPVKMEIVLRELKNRNLYFIDSRTTTETVALEVAERIGFPAIASRDVFLDHHDDPQYIRGQLHQLIKVALRKGYAIAIGHQRSNTVDTIIEVIPEFDSLNVAIVPVSQVIQDILMTKSLP